MDLSGGLVPPTPHLFLQAIFFFLRKAVWKNSPTTPLPFTGLGDFYDSSRGTNSTKLILPLASLTTEVPRHSWQAYDLGGSPNAKAQKKIPLMTWKK